MKAGFSEVIITPPEANCLLAGYALYPATGVHDDLYASLVYLIDGDLEAVLISFDLLAMEKELIARLKSDLRTALALEPDHIFFTCTHTHEGPKSVNANFGTIGWVLPDRITCPPIWIFSATKL
jgi:hypothetical protein